MTVRGRIGRLAPLLPIGSALAAFLCLATGRAAASTAWGVEMSTAPTPDPLATPVMPESPTQVDVGRNLYYYHCMPCHGDRGQGLTEEWRHVWVEDHQDCWARGCHAGRAGDEAFPIPGYVPPINGSPQAIASFRTAEKLYDYLEHTHPPQRPGALAADEYWALTAYVLHTNDRLAADGIVGPGAADSANPGAGMLLAIAIGSLLSGLFVLVAGKRTVRRH